MLRSLLLQRATLLIPVASRHARSFASSAKDRTVVIVSAARTPVGSFQGALASVKAPELGATVIKAVVSQAGM
jgi:hypothetical protein